MEVVVYFVSFSLFRPNMNGTIDKQGADSGLFFPGGCCKRQCSDQSRASAPHSALARTGWCLRGMCPIQKLEKMYFWNSILAIWCIPCGNILLKIHYTFKTNYWLYYHVSRSSFLFWYTCQNYYKSLTIKKGGGGVPPSEAEKILQFLN